MQKKIIIPLVVSFVAGLSSALCIFLVAITYTTKHYANEADQQTQVLEEQVLLAEDQWNKAIQSLEIAESDAAKIRAQLATAEQELLTLRKGLGELKAARELDAIDREKAITKAVEVAVEAREQLIAKQAEQLATAEGEVLRVQQELEELMNTPGIQLAIEKAAERARRDAQRNADFQRMITYWIYSREVKSTSPAGKRYTDNETVVVFDMNKDGVLSDGDEIWQDGRIKHHYSPRNSSMVAFINTFRSTKTGRCLPENMSKIRR